MSLCSSQVVVFVIVVVEVTVIDEVKHVTHEFWKSLHPYPLKPLPLAAGGGFHGCRCGLPWKTPEQPVTISRQKLPSMGLLYMGWCWLPSSCWWAHEHNLVLEESLLGTLKDYSTDSSNIILVQDNPKHTSKLAMKWFKDLYIEVLDWAPSSPDMNIIEHALDCYNSFTYFSLLIFLVYSLHAPAFDFDCWWFYNHLKS